MYDFDFDKGRKKKEKKEKEKEKEEEKFSDSKPRHFQRKWPRQKERKFLSCVMVYPTKDMVFKRTLDLC